MADTETLAAYEGSLARYLAMPLPEGQIAARARFADWVGEGATLLDLGSGPGNDSLFFMERGLTVHALDATQAFVDHAIARGVDARLGTFEDLTEADAYDAVYASFSLLHAPKSAFPGYLAAIHRALKPAGKLFLGMKLGTGEHRDELGRFYSYYTLDELEDHLMTAGFTLTDTTTGMGRGLAGAYEGFALMHAHG